MLKRRRDELQVSIKSNKKTYFSGVCYSITSSNELGEFDILPQHANIICLIKDYIIVDKTSVSEKKIPIRQGILVGKENTVQIFLD